MAAIALGGLVGGLIAGSRFKHTEPGRGLIIGQTIFAILALPLFLVPPGPATVVLVFIVGMPAGVSQIFYIEVVDTVRPRGTAVSALGTLWFIEGSAAAAGTFTTLTSNGTTTLQQITEVMNRKTSATGTVTHDYSTGDVFYHSSISANFTVNLTNVPTTSDRVITVTLLLVQGATPYIPNAFQRDGNAISINWAGGTTPTGRASKTDIVTFLLVNANGTFTVYGQLSSFG
jgi:hypothetical protein